MREDAEDEEHFFKPGLESHQLQGLYLQPDPPQVNNPLTIVASVVAGSELPQTTLMERIASQLHLDYKGQTLIGKPGRAHAVRLQQPDPAYAGARQFVAHVRHGRRASRPLALCAVVRGSARLDVGRPGRRRVSRSAARGSSPTKPATFESEVVGYVQCQKSASRVATTGPDRSFTRVVFVDAVEPKKDALKPATARRPVSEHDRRVLHAHAAIRGERDARGRAPRSADTRRAAPGDHCADTGSEGRRRRLRPVSVSTKPRVFGDGGPAALPVARVRGADSRSERHVLRPRPGLRSRSAPHVSESRPDPGPPGRSAARDRARADPCHHARPGQRQRRHRRDAADGRGDRRSVDAPRQGDAGALPAAAPAGAALGVAGAVRLLHLRAARGTHEPDLVHGAWPLRSSRRG